MQNAIRIILIMLLAAVPAIAGNDAPDTILYTVQDGDSLVKICGKHRHLTNHYALTDLLTDIRRANGLESNFLRVGQKLRIPVVAAREVAKVADPVRHGAEVRGIYLTAPACGSSRVFDRVDAFIAAGGNTVIFDAKDIDGGVSFASGHPYASWGKGRSAPLIPSLTDMMDRFGRRDLYVVARIALFLDGELGRAHPELALQDPAGEPWTERECAWMDPALAGVRDYNLTLAAELARAGVDEIQFDYVRFPTNGWRGDWAGDLSATAARRRGVITDFLSAARDTLRPLGARISADLYGIMAWDRMEDLALTGQHVPTIAALVDVVCPMIYPSHFRPGFEGRRRPGDDPGYFIGEGTRRFYELVDGLAEVRPWLQAFPYRVSVYDGQYIRTQVEAARAAGSAGWSLWNPSCRYSVALAVLPDLAERAPSPVRRPTVVAKRTPRGIRPVAQMPVAAAATTGSSGMFMDAMASRRPDQDQSP